MRTLRTVRLVLGCLLVAATAVLFVGCEEDGDPGLVKEYLDSNSWEGPPEGQAYKDLVLLPTAVTLTTAGQSTLFTATGGKQPYTWTVSDIGLGTIAGGTASAVYQRNGMTLGANVVILTDDRGVTAVASVTQN